MKKDNKIEEACAGEALKSVYTRLISHYLNEIEIKDVDKHNLVMDLITDWNQMNEDDRIDAGLAVAGRYGLAKFLFLMSEITQSTVDESR